MAYGDELSNHNAQSRILNECGRGSDLALDFETGRNAQRIRLRASLESSFLENSDKLDKKVSILQSSTKIGVGCCVLSLNYGVGRECSLLLP